MTSKRKSSASQKDHPFLTLTVCFVFWKALLIAIALMSPGPGYDTSTTLLNHKSYLAFQTDHILSEGLSKFVRWDAVYFTQISLRGYVFEQEWAFGWGFTKLLALLTRVVNKTGQRSPQDAVALAGLALAHGFHLLSCFMLYGLSWNVYNAQTDARRSKFAFVAVCVHIISPAGLFLSVPYAESAFSFFNFSGFYLYMKSLNKQKGQREIKSFFLVLAAGLSFGTATILRSNGLLSGLLFLFELLREISEVKHTSELKSKIFRLSALIGGGSLMTACAIGPQFLAYRTYCLNVAIAVRRQWCTRSIPSIYGWVQSYYWQVGFLKYWTLSNIPLFFLATPMLCILIISSLSTWNVAKMLHPQMSTKIGNKSDEDLPYNRRTAQCMALPQLVLAALALTNYHVQIVTRLSSGYPLWILWLASIILEESETNLLERKWRLGKALTRWIVLYALIQGGLFASFLPPA